MAKEQRFPSPANVAVDKNGKPKLHAQKAAQPQVKVEGKKVDVVRVISKCAHHVILPNSVHAIAPGENYVDAKVMADAMKHPSIAHHVNSGKFVVGTEDEQPVSLKKELDEVPEKAQE